MTVQTRIGIDSLIEQHRRGRMGLLCTRLDVATPLLKASAIIEQFRSNPQPRRDFALRGAPRFCIFVSS
jgi:hypothetical protein